MDGLMPIRWMHEFKLSARTVQISCSTTRDEKQKETEEERKEERNA